MIGVYDGKTSEMINQTEIPMYLENALPDISKDFGDNKKNNPYVAINALITFTCKNIKSHNFQVVKKCFQVAEKLYIKGNTIVKNAIQNVFVYSFTMMFQSFPAEKQKLMAILPLTLYTLYISQVHYMGC